MSESRAVPSRRSLTVVLSSLSSDAHTWNLVFLQLLLEEMGHRVVNLGACVPDEFLVAECLRHRPDALVISTVNGHGHIDGLRAIGRLRAEESLADMPVIIGGKLTVDGDAGHVAGRAARRRIRHRVRRQQSGGGLPHPHRGHLSREPRPPGAAMTAFP